MHKPQKLFFPNRGSAKTKLAISSMVASAILALTPVALAVLAGNGPGGVGTTNGTSELELWVKADSLSLSNGAAVFNWPDSSGSGHALVQSAPSKQPVFVLGALGQKPVVRFTNDSFSNITLLSSNNEFSLVVVLKPARTNIYQDVLDGPGATRPMLWIDTLGNYEFNFNSGAVTASTGGYDIIECIKNNSVGACSQEYLNGPTRSAYGADNFNIPASASYSFFNRADAQQFSGDVAELIIYNTSLTPQEINEVGYYLQQKYGIAGSFYSTLPQIVGYQQNPAIYGVNSAIDVNSPIVTNGVTTNFSISPALPPGLVFDTTTGNVSGTPNAISQQTIYTVIATFTGQQNATNILSLGVTVPTLVGYSPVLNDFTRTVAAAPIEPVLRGGPVSEFTASPALPASLVLNPQTGVISGTPTVTTSLASYTITASFNGYASSSYALSLQILEFSTNLDISEFMAANHTTIADGDGNYSDWVEIHNYGTLPIDLCNWSLTDNASKLRKWIFPPHLLAPGGYLLVFCTGSSHPSSYIDPAGYMHASFALAASGEYLALVRPDGVTIARQFAPTFPPQTDDISYGTPDDINYGYYTVPTPGAPNGFFTSIQAVVAATPAGRTFTNNLSVALAAELTAGAVIRYTLDGTAPTSSSPIYTAPLLLTTNVELRTKVFAPGLDPGPETSQVYLCLGADLVSFSSNLPLIFLTTDGPIPPTSATNTVGCSTVFVDLDPVTQRAAANGTPNYAGRGGIRVRGRTSASFPQQQYKFDTYNSLGQEVTMPLLGIPSVSDWVLYAPWSDKSLIRDALAYSTWSNFGRPSLDLRFAEVFLNNETNSVITFSNNYVGVYMLVQHINLEAIGIDPPENTANPADITGGYSIEAGDADDDNFETFGSGSAVAYSYEDPDAQDLNTEQAAWPSNYITTFERSLYGAGFTNPATGLSYTNYTDVGSQVDYKVAREWSRNFDGGSMFFYIPQGGTLTMGPLWDYNWAFGNVNYAEGGDLPGYYTNGWNLSFTATNVNGWAPWYARFDQDPDFWQQFVDRWTDLREGILNAAAMNASINAYTIPLAQEAAGRNFIRWPQLGLFTDISAPGWQNRTTYQSEVDYLKGWTEARSEWIDAQFPGRPAFSIAPGQVSAGASLTLALTNAPTIFTVTNALTVFYYTLDGSDPRMPGGAVNPAAASATSGQNITINNSALIITRANWNTTNWGAPNVGGYVVGNAAAPTNLVISELNYDPAGPTSAELNAIPGVSAQDFEFIELHNIGAASVDLTGAAFTKGIQFTFPAGLSLAPGAYLVVVSDPAAFVLRYGTNATVAGQYTGHLNNSGETLILSAADGSEIAYLDYNSAWSAAASGGGYALNLLNDSLIPINYSMPGAWALSAQVGGSPGTSNGPTFSMDYTLWVQTTFTPADATNSLVSGPSADPDGDGAANLLEFALGSSPLNARSVPKIIPTLNGTNFWFTFTRPKNLVGLEYTVQQSSNLVSWTPVSQSLQIVSSTNSSETVGLTLPFDGISNLFFRLQVLLIY